MRSFLGFAVIIAVFSLGDTYSKYGRSCKDIGCTSNQVCVMVEEPCTAYTRNNECGKYPTCKKVSNAAATCATFVCPPSQICRMDGGQPKCFDDASATGNRENKHSVQSYNPISPDADTPNAPVFPQSNPQPNIPHHSNNPPQYYPQNPGNNPNYPQNPGYNPNYPQNPGAYPNLQPGQTTQRPNVYQQGQRVGGGGYQGGAIGSGYPGAPGYTGQGQGQGQGQAGYPRQSGGYPVQNGGYPVQGGGYPGQTYSGQGHNTQGGYNTRGGYPTQGGGYSNQGGGYYNQGTNQNRGQRYGQKSGEDSSNPLLDRITGTLKTLGTNFLKETFNIKL